MMQLWIGGNLIGDISGLRTVFRGANGDRFDALCAELLDKLLTGKFTPWLSRCLEARHRRGNCDRKQDATWKIEDLEECRIQLEQEAASGALSDAGVAALAKICGLSDETVRKVAQARMRMRSQRKRLSDVEWWSKVHSLEWWPQLDRHHQEDMNGLRREYMAINTDELYYTLENVFHENSMIDIFLLNDGMPFLIPDLPQVRNIRFVGCGSPTVNIDPNFSDHRLNMRERNLVFEGIRLFRYGVRVEDPEGDRLIVVTG